VTFKNRQTPRRGRESQRKSGEEKNEQENAGGRERALKRPGNNLKKARQRTLKPAEMGSPLISNPQECFEQQQGLANQGIANGIAFGKVLGSLRI